MFFSRKVNIRISIAMLMGILSHAAVAVADQTDSACTSSTESLASQVCLQKSLATIPDLLPQDSIRGRYIPGKGYLLSSPENVGLSIFRKRVIDEVNRVRSTKSMNLFAAPAIDALQETGDSFSQVPEDELMGAALTVMRSPAEPRALIGGAPQEKMFVSVLTPAVAIAGLAGLDMVLDDVINRANSSAASALFALRSHIAASQADLNIIFKKRMDEAFDKLSVHEQTILTAAQVLAANAESTIRKVEKDGYEHASDLVCQTTVGFANYSIGLPISRLLPPDLVCLKEADIRDVGPQHEQLLTFRGVHLQPKEEYPEAKISVAGQEIRTITGGGNQLLQVPLPGGVNGAPNDLSSRGDRIAQAEFTWKKSDRTRRWLFVLKPYLVSSLDAKLTPTIKGPVYKEKTQSCYLKADGGSWSAREEHATCTILVDDGWEMDACTESAPTTARGNAGIENKLSSIGACQWAMKAKSESRWGKGSWYGFEGRAMMKKIIEISGKTYEERQVLNMPAKGTTFSYPAADLIPKGYEIQQGKWSWQVDYFDNTDEKHVFTTAEPSVVNVGIGTMEITGSNVLTWKKLP